jgi:hypothetical protein
MLFMVIERFKRDSVKEIYARLNKQGRMMPSGLEYIDSWVDDEHCRCFQLVRTEDETLLQEWTSHWIDLVEFEVVRVISSREMRNYVCLLI